MLDPARSYDLIGDVHGCAHTLEHLLDRLGYQKHSGVWRHARRMAVFLGDVIDRGPRIREALHIVHDMVEAGQALCIMGNHEFNALGWSTPAPPGSGKEYVREHTPRHARLIDETLTQFAHHPGDWHDFLAWFYEMPLFVDAGRFRVVHACWDGALIDVLRQQYPEGRVDEHFVQAAAVPGSFACMAFDRLLRGTDMRLPHGQTMTSGDGLTRAFFRTKFWEDNPQTYGDIVFQPDALPDPVAQTLLSPVEKTDCCVTTPNSRCCLSATTGAAARRHRSAPTWRAWITAPCSTASWSPTAWTRKPASTRTSSSGSMLNGRRPRNDCCCRTAPAAEC